MTKINMNMKFFALVIFAGLLGTGVCISWAATSGGSEWPAQDITIIVAYNPGGFSDLLARATANFLPKYLPKRVNVIVKNIPGAGGRIGLREFLKAKPDGLTLGMFQPQEIELARAGGQFEGMNIEKISWLAILLHEPDILIVGPKSEFKKYSDMKGKPVKFATLGFHGDIRIYLIARRIGAKVQMVRYEGTSDAFLSVLRGDVDAVFLNWITSMRQFRATGGQLIPLFVDTDKRIPGVDVPTALELGIKLEEVVMGDTHSLAAPPGFTPELKGMWEEILLKVFNDPDSLAQIKKMGLPATPLTGDKLNATIKTIRGVLDKNKDIMDIINRGS